jgi:hypothetical protein
MYAPYNAKFFARKHCIVVPHVLRVEHFFIRLYIPIVVVLIFDRGFVKDLSGADMIVACETSQQ